MANSLAYRVLPVVLIFSTTGPAAAQAAEPPDFSLTVTPHRLVVPVDQLSRPQRFTVTNGGREAVEVLVRVDNFTTGPDGTPRFTPDAPHSAVGWFRPEPDRFHLAPGASTRVALQLRVPADADPGEHRAAVIFTVPPTGDGPGINIGRAVGAPVYVTAPGAVVEAVEVDRLRAPAFALGGPIEFDVTLRNVGTVRRDFTGTGGLALRVAASRQPVTDRTLPVEEFTLLRDAERQLTVRWSDPPPFCVCDVTLAVPGPDGTDHTVRTRLVVISPWLLASVLGVLAVLLATVGWLLLRRRTGDAGGESGGESDGDERRGGHPDGPGTDPLTIGGWHA
jgi:hypothetical protein